MRFLKAAVLALAFAALVFGQGATGTITGTVSDQTGAVVANAAIQAKQTETNVTFDAASTSTGNYTLVSLPVGTYEVTATVTGFKKFNRPNVVVTVASVVRIDIQLEVGAASESVTVDETAPLLQTESGDVSTNVQTEAVTSLPLITMGSSLAGSSGMRNPQGAYYLIPGTYVQENSVTRVNGIPGNTYSIRVEGQPIENGNQGGTQAQQQPSVDMIQEVTIQTSNYAAEYGLAAGGYFNYTMKSGTNGLHGSGYDYFTDEFLNASQPFDNLICGFGSTSTRCNPYVKPESRRNDYGITIGGPLVLPKLYNGRNKTFWYGNWEQYREKLYINNEAVTVPTAAYRQGNFSSVPGVYNATVGGFVEGTIYDPNTVNGVGVTTPFASNTIPQSRLNPSALAIQGYVPLPTNTGQPFSNYLNPYFSQRHTEAPAFKFDHTINSRAKVSYYWQHTQTDSALSPQLSGADGMLGANLPITQAMGTYFKAIAMRANFDYTITPTLLFHIGVGFLRTTNNDDPLVTNFPTSACPNFSGGSPSLAVAATSSCPAITIDPVNGVNSGGLGIPNVPVPNRLFPLINGSTSADTSLCNASTSSGYYADTCTGAGGLKTLGTVQNRTPIRYEKPAASYSLTWVKGNHTYKFGGEVKITNNFSRLCTYCSGNYNFANAETAIPSLSTTTEGGVSNAIGFEYASFLLGAVDNYRLAPYINTHQGQNAEGFFVQDSWKLTRKLTVDYGIRYDFQTYTKPGDNANPFALFDPTLANTSAGGEPGAVQFNGFGPGLCNCNVAKNYPWAWAPRLGFAYQVLPKTVIRGGFGVIYGYVSDAQSSGGGAAWTIPAGFTSPNFGTPSMILSQGPNLPIPTFPNLNPYQYPAIPASISPQYQTTQAPALFMDQNAGRPPRIWEYSFTIEREITPNTLFSASYVGNSGVWEQATMDDPNGTSCATLAHYNLPLCGVSAAVAATNYGILNSKLSTPAANTAGFGICAACNAFGTGQGIPYSGFPLTATIAQAIRPYPQFSTIIQSYSPQGVSNYNALQIKLNKRFSHGLEVSSFYTWSKNMGTGTATPINNATSVAFSGNSSCDLFNRPTCYALSQYDEPQVLTIAPSYTTPRVKWGGDTGAWKFVDVLARDWKITGLFAYSSGLPIATPQGANSLNNAVEHGTPNVGYEIPTGQPFYLVDINCHCYDPFATQILNPAAFAQPTNGVFGDGAPYYSGFRNQRRPNESLGFGREIVFRERLRFSIRAEFENIFNRAEPPAPTATNTTTTTTHTTGTFTTTTCPPGYTCSSGYGYETPTSIGTSTNIQTAPNRAGQLIARFSF